MNNRHKLAATLCALIAATTLHAQQAQQTTNEKFFDGANDPASQQVMRQAEADIEQYRKGDFTITIEFADATQSPPIQNPQSKIQNPVTLDLIRHQFNFGCSMFGMARLPDGDPMKKAGIQTLLDLFNTVAVVDPWSNPYEKLADQHPAEDMAWAKAHHMRTRYVAVLYEEPLEFIGKGLTTEQYWREFDKRTRYCADITGGKADSYDVINEVVSRKYWFKDNPKSFYRLEPQYPDLSQPAEIIRAFALARKYLPGATLVALENGLPSTAQKQYKEIIATWKAALDAGAAIDRIATQCHFFDDGQSFKPWERKKQKDFYTMGEISKGLDLQKVLNKPVEIAEFTGPSRNKQKTPEYNKRIWTLTEEENCAWQINFYKLAFSKPYITGLTRWNLVDQYCGRSMDGGMLTPTGDKHQIHDALKKLIKETWHTRVTHPLDNNTAAATTIAFRGFYGDYQVTAPGYAPLEITLTPETKTAKVVLKREPPSPPANRLRTDAE